MIVPLLRELLPDVKSVVDFGAAQGVWLNTWIENGVNDIQGIDGDYVERSALMIPSENFKAADLNEPIQLNRQFDLAYSLEVAEHLRPESSEDFIDTLTTHAPIVLFSAAPPGQGGETHINERSLDSWRKMFQVKDYIAYDCVRPIIATNTEVSFWYRYNTILYAHSSMESSLPDAIRNTRIGDSSKITDVSPAWFKLRKFVVRLLPHHIQNMLARVKAMMSGRSR